MGLTSTLHRLLLVGGALLPAWFGLCTSAAMGQASQPSQQEQMRINLRAQYDAQTNQAKSLPKLDVKGMEDVFQLTVKDGKALIVKTPAIDAAEGKGQRFQVNLQEFTGPSFVQTSNAAVGMIPVKGPKGAAPAPQKMMRIFTFTNCEQPDPDTLVTTSVQTFQNTFHIAVNTQRAEAFWMTRLMDQRDPDHPDAGIIQFMVIRNGGDFNDQININITEPDFPTLLRNHPQEVDEYLRPLLRRLGQEQLFAPAWHVAWQVLADYFPVDAKIAEQIAAILPDLNDADFRRREKSLAALVKLDQPGAAVLRKMSRQKLSAEQNRGIDLALSPFDQLPDAEAVRLQGDKKFLLDCLYSEELTIRKAAIEQLRKLTEDQGLQYDPDGKISDRLAAIRSLRQKLLEKQGPRPTTTPTTAPAAAAAQPSTSPSTMPAK